MITIFSIIHDIYHKKKGNLYKQSEFTNVVKSPYLLQRWISMGDPLNAYILNETTNRIYSGIGNDSEVWYKLLMTLIEKNINYKKTAYIKKSSEKTSEKIEKMINTLQERNNLSRREVEEYLELEKSLNMDIERHEKLI